MGIDLDKGGRGKNRSLKTSRSTDVYTKLLIKLYTFLHRRTGSKFNRVVLKRLQGSRIQRYPISISRILKSVKKNMNKTIVCVCKVVDDERLLIVPKMTVCALKFSEQARKRILAAGGQCLTFDQLALKAPTGTNTIMLRGPKSREALRHFGPAPGTKGSHTKPYTSGKSHNIERARGR